MLHQNPRSALSLSDEYETPHDVFNSICNKHEVIPIVDVCASVYNKNDINIIMLIPANTCSSIYWHDFIEGNAEYHAVKGRIRFLRDGVPSEFMSRNAYMCVIFRKK